MHVCVSACLILARPSLKTAAKNLPQLAVKLFPLDPAVPPSLELHILSRVEIFPAFKFYSIDNRGDKLLQDLSTLERDDLELECSIS